MYFRQSWYDPRLAFSGPPNRSTTFMGEATKKFWHPYTYFENGRKGKIHEITGTNKVVRVFADGRVFSSIRLYQFHSSSIHLPTHPRIHLFIPLVPPSIHPFRPSVRPSAQIYPPQPPSQSLYLSLHANTDHEYLVVHSPSLGWLILYS